MSSSAEKRDPSPVERFAFKYVALVENFQTRRAILKNENDPRWEVPPLSLEGYLFFAMNPESGAVLPPKDELDAMKTMIRTFSLRGLDGNALTPDLIKHETKLLYDDHFRRANKDIYDAMVDIEVRKKKGKKKKNFLSLCSRFITHRTPHQV